MALSYNLGYQESISVHPTRRQIFAGKPYSTFPNIWKWLISENSIENRFEIYTVQIKVVYVWTNVGEKVVEKQEELQVIWGGVLFADMEKLNVVNVRLAVWKNMLIQRLIFLGSFQLPPYLGSDSQPVS